MAKNFDVENMMVASVAMEVKGLFAICYGSAYDSFQSFHFYIPWFSNNFRSVRTVDKCLSHRERLVY